MPTPPPLLAALAALALGACSQPAPSTAASRAPADTTDTRVRIPEGGPEFGGPVMVGPMMADPVYSAATLVEAMAARYPDWYRTVSFTQRTGRRTDGAVSVETWREWAAVPGRLRIEMGDPLAGLDVLFVDDTTYVYRDGQLAAARADRNPLLFWGFDVYAQDPAASLAVLEAEGYDLDAFRTDVWDGKEAYVLGTPAAGEVWVERDRLLFVRLVGPAAGGGTQDVRFENYRPLGGGWIAPFVTVRVDDELVLWETYSDVVANPTLDPVLFAPRRWADGVAQTRAGAR